MDLNPQPAPYRGAALPLSYGGNIYAVRVLVLMGTIIALSACQSIPPAPTEIRIPISVPCVERSQLPQVPKIATDSELAKLNDFDFVIQLAISRTLLTQYSNEQKALLEACSP